MECGMRKKRDIWQKKTFKFREKTSQMFNIKNASLSKRKKTNKKTQIKVDLKQSALRVLQLKNHLINLIDHWLKYFGFVQINSYLVNQQKYLCLHLKIKISIFQQNAFYCYSIWIKLILVRIIIFIYIKIQ